MGEFLKKTNDCYRASLWIQSDFYSGHLSSAVCAFKSAVNLWPRLQYLMHLWLKSSGVRSEAQSGFPSLRPQTLLHTEVRETGSAPGQKDNKLNSGQLCHPKTTHQKPDTLTSYLKTCQNIKRHTFLIYIFYINAAGFVFPTPFPGLRFVQDFQHLISATNHWGGLV